MAIGIPEVLLILVVLLLALAGLGAVIWLVLYIAKSCQTDTPPEPPSAKQENQDR